MDSLGGCGFDGVDGAIRVEVVDHDDVADAAVRVGGVDGKVAGDDSGGFDFFER